jgi:hypothetical protein
MKSLPRLAAVVVAALTMTGCSWFGGTSVSSSPSPVASYNPASRPSSPAKLRFIQPQDQAQVKAGVVHVQLALEGASIVSQTTRNITPTTGHIHFSVNDKLIAMNYSTMQDVPLTAGLYRLTAEFVAADHIPFSPRVQTSIVVIVQ